MKEKSKIKDQKSKMLERGFTILELVMAMGFMVMMLALVTINFGNVQRQGSVTTASETLITDLSQQQIKAMVGDTEGRVANDDYGIKFNSTNYTLFHGTYSALETTNFSVNLPEIVRVDTTFANSEIIFLKGSGEIKDFVDGSNTITLRETINSNQKTIRFNRYGVITQVN